MAVVRAEVEDVEVVGELPIWEFCLDDAGGDVQPFVEALKRAVHRRRVDAVRSTDSLASILAQLESHRHLQYLHRMPRIARKPKNVAIDEESAASVEEMLDGHANAGGVMRFGIQEADQLQQFVASVAHHGEEEELLLVDPREPGLRCLAGLRALALRVDVHSCQDQRLHVEHETPLRLAEAVEALLGVLQVLDGLAFNRRALDGLPVVLVDELDVGAVLDQLRQRRLASDAVVQHVRQHRVGRPRPRQDPARGAFGIAAQTRSFRTAVKWRFARF